MHLIVCGPGRVPRAWRAGVVSSSGFFTSARWGFGSGLGRGKPGSTCLHVDRLGETHGSLCELNWHAFLDREVWDTVLSQSA